MFGDGIGNDNICCCAKYETANRPQGEWIPCSERLPESDGDYIVNFHSKFPKIDEYDTIEVAEFRQGAWDDTMYSKFTAWMQLPQEYRGESE